MTFLTFTNYFIFFTLLIIDVYTWFTGGPQPWNQGPASTPPGVIGNVPPATVVPPGPPQVMPQDANAGIAPGAPGGPAPL